MAGGIDRKGARRPTSYGPKDHLLRAYPPVEQWDSLGIDCVGADHSRGRGCEDLVVGHGGACRRCPGRHGVRSRRRARPTPLPEAGDQLTIERLSRPLSSGP